MLKVCGYWVSSTAYITLEMVHLGFKSLYHQVGRGLVFIYLKGFWVLKISNNHNYAYFRMKKSNFWRCEFVSFLLSSVLLWET